MARHSLGVGDDDPIRVRAEHAAQGADLGLGAAPSRRGIGLVGDEHSLCRDLGPIDAVPLFAFGD